jgi:uncharacterized membrane protein
MEGLVFLLIVVLILALPVCAIVSASNTRRETNDLRKEVERLRKLCANLHDRLQGLAAKANGLHSEKTIAPPIPDPMSEKPLIEATAGFRPATPPPLKMPPSDALPKAAPEGETDIVPPQLPEVPPKPPKPAVSLPEINLEMFMGAKLFAWMGGLALFLGVVFFVKHSMEQGWISPAMRMATGLVTGAGLVVGGVILHRKARYTVLAQTLCATGIVSLYGVSFAAHAIWPVRPFGSALATFGFMAVVTAVAFLLAVRLNAQVVAVLGLLGGFLTPVLCSTGQDNPFGLWSYIALLCLGLLAVVRRTKWHHLVPLAAGAVVVMQLGWLDKFWTISG